MDIDEKRYVLHRDIVFREEDDGAFLFNPQTDALQCINPVGAAICRLCDGSNDLDGICRRIGEQFEVAVDLTTLRADIAGFIEKLLSLNLLQTC